MTICPEQFIEKEKKLDKGQKRKGQQRSKSCRAVIKKVTFLEYALSSLPSFVIP